MDQQVWVRRAGHVSGPFSAEQLRRLAADRKLNPADEVSTDRQRWVRATRVKGLQFPTPSDAGTSRQAPQDARVEAGPLDSVPFAEEDGGGEYGVAGELPSASPPNEAALGSVPGSHAAACALGDPRQNSVRVPQKQTGLAWGLLIGLGCLLGSLGLALPLASSMGDTAYMIPAIAAALAPLIVILGAVGTANRITVIRNSDGQVVFTMHRRIAFLPFSAKSVTLSPNDYVLKILGVQSQGKVDVVMICITVFLLLLGVAPGIFFWFAWHGARQKAQSSCRVSLYLVASGLRRPVKLYARLVEDYFGTRFGDPREVREITKAFTELAPIEIRERQVERTIWTDLFPLRKLRL